MTAPAWLGCRALPIGRKQALSAARLFRYPGSMEKQSLIRRTLSSPAGFERLSGILEGEAFENRSAAVRRVCDSLGILDARGRPMAFR